MLIAGVCCRVRPEPLAISGISPKTTAFGFSETLAGLPNNVVFVDVGPLQLLHLELRYVKCRAHWELPCTRPLLQDGCWRRYLVMERTLALMNYARTSDAYTLTGSAEQVCLHNADAAR